ncbi:uncharacterized protein METZ01_LOCUS464300, partial [marine metagenome]
CFPEITTFMYKLLVLSLLVEANR